MALGPLREARSLREDELLELTHTLRKELELRGERLPAAWTEEAVGDLRSGRLSGWARPPGDPGGELGFYSRRGRRAFGHIHLLPGPSAEARAVELLRRIADDPGLGELPVTLGITGLQPAEEEAVARAWSDRPSRTAVAREGLELVLNEPARWEDPGPLPGFAPVPADRITEAAIADLDWRGFAGSLDARLFGSDPSENARMIDDLLAGGLGRLLPEASRGLLDGSGRLAGLLVTVEISPRIGLFADLVVDPAHRRAGLGRYLLRWGCRALRALGHERARLWVTEGNVPARTLYESLGFRTYARAQVYLQDVRLSEPQPQTDR